MIGKRVIATAASAALIAAVTTGLALAHGFGGPRGGGNQMGLLAHAAGLTHSQIMTVFEGNTKLQTDRANLKTAHQAMMSCLVASGSDCTTQISSYAADLQTMTQDQMLAWQGLFKSAPNLAQAASVYSQLQQLQSQRKQILQGVFGSNSTQGSGTDGTWPGNG
jgi:hypothetical protein